MVNDWPRMRWLGQYSPIPEMQPSPVPRSSVRFTNTAVPKFDGTVCWHQHQQVFNAIAKSNGWDGETAALQLFAHLEGDALNVALLMPEAKRATRNGLSEALSDYYNSLGRLAMELEILAARGFGEAGPSTRTRMVRDRFMSGHRDCELRQHLDSVSPDTPILDIEDRCLVWESHSDKNQRLPAVTNNSRRYSIVTSETPGIEPWFSVAMVRTAPLEEPTILEVLARRILDQTGNCGEESPTITEPPLVNSWGTLKVTEDRPVYTSRRTRELQVWGVGLPLSGCPRISRRC